LREGKTKEINYYPIYAFTKSSLKNNKLGIVVNYFARVSKLLHKDIERNSVILNFLIIEGLIVLFINKEKKKAFVIKY
jgi:hypothetical protein